MTLPSVIKEELVRLVDKLSPETAAEVRQFIEARQHASTPAAALGGLLADYRFSPEAIAAARAEMWGRFGSRPA